MICEKDDKSDIATLDKKYVELLLLCLHLRNTSTYLLIRSRESGEVRDEEVWETMLIRIFVCLALCSNRKYLVPSDLTVGQFCYVSVQAVSLVLPSGFGTEGRPNGLSARVGETIERVASRWIQ